jgi:hypothetical protein
MTTGFVTIFSRSKEPKPQPICHYLMIPVLNLGGMGGLYLNDSHLVLRVTDSHIHSSGHNSAPPHPNESVRAILTLLEAI